MRDATLCLLLAGDPADKILLGMKKRGLGVGKFNGFGGKVENGETVLAATVREVYEEAGLVVEPQDLNRAGTIAFHFSAMPENDFTGHVFLAKTWRGEAIETAEMAPQWFAIKDIPYSRMWQDDRFWLPRVLRGEPIAAICVFAEDNETVKSFVFSPGEPDLCSKKT